METHQSRTFFSSLFGSWALAAVVVSLLPLGAMATTTVDQDIVQDTTWYAAGSPYFIERGYLELASGATLTIEPGVTVQFWNWDHHLTVNGLLIAEGTEAEPITFTSDEAIKARGQWSGLWFETEESGGSRLSHCILEAGGSSWVSPYALIYCANGATPQISNCTLRMSACDGIYCDEGSPAPISSCTITDVGEYGIVLRNSSPVLTDNTITNCGYDAILLASTESGASYPSYSGNTFGDEDYVRIEGDFTSSGTLRNPRQAYFVGTGYLGLPSGATLTIEPGVSVQFWNWDHHLTVNGLLIAEGTEAKPITFTSDEAIKARGQWSGLWFETEESSGSRLSHCIIEAGGSSWVSPYALIYCANGATPQISNCTLRMSYTNGIYCDEGSPAPICSCTITDVGEYGIVLRNSSSILTDNTITNCGYDAILLASTESGASYPSYSGNTFGDEDYVRIEGDFTSSGTLRNPSQAYFVGTGYLGLPSGATLTIEPGVTVQFWNWDHHLTVNGVLVAEGTEAEPITFTSDEAIKGRGQWSGLWFETEESSGSRLSHCIIEAGGRGGVWPYALIYCANGAAPELFGCTLRMSGSDGIRCETSGSPVVRKCSIMDIDGWGLLNSDASTLVDARENWWGDASGPLDNSDAEDMAHLYNPEGLGCKVSDNVDYSDWLGSPPTFPVEPPYPAVDFTAHIRMGQAPFLVQFTDLSTNTATSWLWSFGDGATSTEQNPPHTYNQAGRYSVSLIAQNEEGAGSCMKPRYIWVIRDADNAGAGDGMDDDWEIAYFGSTDQPPDGDFDGDGATNLEEFLAGTDPTDDQSVLVITSWQIRADGFAYLSWDAVESNLYEVQYRDLLEAEGDWLPFTRVDVTCSGTVSIGLPPEDFDRRFYRVAVVPVP